MAKSAGFREEKCFNVCWRIKEFSYCRKQMRSPEFNFHGNQYFIQFMMQSPNIECNLVCSVEHRRDIYFMMKISFLTYDGSPEESVSGDQHICLVMPRDVIFGRRRKSFLPADMLSVEFRMLTAFERGTLSMCSEIIVKRKCFMWTIKDFSSCATRSLQENMKKSVQCASYGDIELALKPVDSRNAPRKYGMEISRSAGEECFGSLTVSLLDVDGKSRHTASNEFSFGKNTSETFSFPFIIEKSKLLARKKLLLPNNVLSLNCDLAISLGALLDRTSVLLYHDDVTPLVKGFDALSMTFEEGDISNYATELQTDLRSVLEDETLFDVDLRVGSEVIRAHKVILSARSPVFRAMFTRGMKEATDHAVVIEDLSAATVRKLVTFMYTDAVPGCRWQDVKELYFAADKYEVRGLKRRCASYLESNLSVGNACETLTVADLHRDAELKAAAIDFISDHNSAVYDSPAWKEMGKNSPSLALEVAQQDCSNKRSRLA